MTVFTEGTHAAEAVLRESEGGMSRANLRIGALQTVAACALLALLAAGGDASAEVTPGGSNTGNGVLTLAEPALGPDAHDGEYIVEVTGGTYDVAAPTFAGTGDGTLTLANPKFTGNPQLGEWKMVAVEKTADSGEFLVKRPDGTIEGTAVVGTPFVAVNGPNFTIDDGATDFAQNAVFTLAVTSVVPANGLGTFKVTAPDTTVVAEGTIGTAFVSTHVNFTWADGSINVVTGDTQTITVTRDVDVFGAYDPTATDGRQIPCAMSLYAVTTGADETKDVAAIVWNAQININCVAWPDGITADQKDAAIAAMAKVKSGLHDKDDRDFTCGAIRLR